MQKHSKSYQTACQCRKGMKKILGDLALYKYEIPQTAPSRTPRPPPSHKSWTDEQTDIRPSRFINYFRAYGGGEGWQNFKALRVCVCVRTCVGMRSSVCPRLVPLDRFSPHLPSTQVLGVAREVIAMIALTPTVDTISVEVTLKVLPGGVATI